MDDRYLPVLISTWIGPPIPPLVRKSFARTDELLHEARENGTKIVQAVDTLLAGRPDSITRKVISELSDAQTDRYGDLILTPTAVAINNPLLRGAITSINWITRNSLDVDVHRTMEATIRAALGRLDRAGIRRPDGLEPAGYVCPGLGDEARSSG